MCGLCTEQLVCWCVVGLAAVRIGTDKAFMLKLVDWCQTEDHAGVQGSLSLLLVLLHTWYTHTHPFNGPLSVTTQVSRYQKGKTNLDLTEAQDSEWQ